LFFNSHMSAFRAVGSCYKRTLNEDGVCPQVLQKQFQRRLEDATTGHSASEPTRKRKLEADSEANAPRKRRAPLRGDMEVLMSVCLNGETPLHEHLASPEDENKPHKCTLDDYESPFKDKSKSNKQLQIHANERPFKCPYEGCEASFKQKAPLNIHIRIHTGERPYKCTYAGCSVAFSDQSNLTKHLKIHSGVKSHSCTAEGCLASFFLRSDLKRHMKAHTREKPFACNIEGCSSVFKRRDNLRRHVRDVHGVQL